MGSAVLGTGLLPWKGDSNILLVAASTQGSGGVFGHASTSSNGGQLHWDGILLKLDATTGGPVSSSPPNLYRWDSEQQGHDEILGLCQSPLGDVYVVGVNNGIGPHQVTTDLSIPAPQACVDSVPRTTCQKFHPPCGCIGAT